MLYTFGHARTCTAPENRSGPSLGPPGVPSVHPYVAAILFYPLLAPVVGLFGGHFALRTAKIAYLPALFHAPSRFLHTFPHFSSIRPPSDAIICFGVAALVVDAAVVVDAVVVDAAVVDAAAVDAVVVVVAAVVVAVVVVVVAVVGGVVDV